MPEPTFDQKGASVSPSAAPSNRILINASKGDGVGDGIVANKPVLKQKGEVPISPVPISPQEATDSGRPKRAATKHKGWIHGRLEQSAFQAHAACPEAIPLITRITMANYFSFYGDQKTALSLIGYNDLQYLEMSAYRVSLGAALKMTDRREDIHSSIQAEINNLKESRTLRLLRRKEVTREVMKDTIPCHLFLKFKYKADGSPDKIKSRLAANGNDQDPESIGETFAPTVNPISVKTHLALTAREKLHLAAYDIKGAFLLPSTAGRKRKLFIKIPKNVVALWIKFYPEDAIYVLEDGTMVAELEKYLYGLAESPRQFNNFLDDKLRNIGFTRLRADPCSYIRYTRHGKVLVSVHVDDMLVSCSSLKDQKRFEEEMSKHFQLVAQRGSNISYLGMNISYDRDTQKLTVNQQGMIEELLKRYKCEHLSKVPRTPATSVLFEGNLKSAENPKVSRKKFLSLLMTLMYIGRFTRHDILLPVTALATKSSEPREHDLKQALRVVKYLSGTRNVKLTFDGTVPLKPIIYADASHCIHPSGHGHGGIIISLGSAPIHAQSYKLKVATRSTSESELVVLEESATYAVWLRLLLTELGILAKDSKPIPIFQDNKSTIIIANAGSGTFKRTKHLLSREAFVREKVETGEIKLVYKPTASMTADFLTKPLPKSQLEHHLQTLRMV